nr:MAG TPA: hypothetical protein [Bacteriophage sp.]
MKMYCIYDKKGELMNPPFTQANNDAPFSKRSCSYENVLYL